MALSTRSAAFLPLSFLLMIGSLSSMDCGAQTPLHSITGPGAVANGSFGAALAGGGDVNGDGVPDILVGSPNEGTLLPGAGAVRVYSGSGISLMYSITGVINGNEFGGSLDFAGDVNADGFDDFIVGCPGFDQPLFDQGMARVYSGQTGLALYQWDGDRPLSRAGLRVTGVGDINLDGFDDVAASAQSFNFAPALSGLRVYSGLDGSILFTHLADSPGDGLGLSLAAAGDVNGDGRGDYIAGAPYDDDNGSNSGSARVYSGIDGAPLFTIRGDSIGDEFGTSVAGIGDLNGDGLNDLIVGAPKSGPSANEAGLARVFSGYDGTVLLNLPGTLPGAHFGSSVSGAGDLDGDGVEDLLVASSSASPNGSFSGSVTVISGATGLNLLVIEGTQAGDGLGRAVSRLGDLDGDNSPEFLVSAPGADSNGPNAGLVELLKLDPPSVALTQLQLPIIGTTQSFEIKSSRQSPGTAYFFDLSANGSTPGLQLPAPMSAVFPLNPPFLNLSYGVTLPGIFSAFSGTLDVVGSATPSLNIPATPALVGMTLSAAVATLDPNQPWGIEAISPGLTFTILDLPPTLISVSPSACHTTGGSPLTLIGTRFDAGATVQVGGVFASSVVVLNSHTLSCTIPPGSPGAAAIRVTNPDGQTAVLSGSSFTYLPSPSVLSVSPASALPGTTITILGSGLGVISSLSVGGTPVTPTLQSIGRIDFVLPGGLGCDTSIVLDAPCLLPITLAFNATPIVSSTLGTNVTAQGGTIFYIFGEHLGTASVTVGGVPASIHFGSPQALWVAVPPGTPGTAPILVTSASGCTASAGVMTYF